MSVLTQLWQLWLRAVLPYFSNGPLVPASGGIVAEIRGDEFKDGAKYSICEI